MLEVISLEDACALINDRFVAVGSGVEHVELDKALGRVAASGVVSQEGVPPFDRSTVDGFAVRASDTFGCSDSLPALLELSGEILMGAPPACTCEPATCVRIPTGGQVPDGADAVAMLEYCEDYGDGTIGVARAVAPGENLVFKNDDVKPGQTLIEKGVQLKPHHIGTLASLGETTCAVVTKPRVGIISTGDEIIDISQVPVASQMRDVNAPMMAAAVTACAADPVLYGIVPDDYDALLDVVSRAVAECDAVLVSGGSSAGEKDNTARVLRELGQLLFHGIAVKPGKPTMCADISGLPVFGLPGHPVAAYFMFLELVKPLLIRSAGMEGQKKECGGSKTVGAVLSEGIPSNHGRAELVAVRLRRNDCGLIAVPVRGKSGLISQLSDADGYVRIGRDTEGLSAGANVDVRLFDM